MRKDGPFGLINIAQQAVKAAGTWVRCGKRGFRGRCWGDASESSESRQPGSNITLGEGDHIVIVRMQRRGSIIVESYVRSSGSALEDEVRAVITQAGLPISGPP